MTEAAILVIEDDAAIRELVEQALEDAGYRVVVSDDLGSIELARNLAPRLILLDLMMPRLDGAEISQALRRDPMTAVIPIIAMTARRRDKAPDGVIADDWLAKPFDLADLYAMVARWDGSVSSA